MDVSYNTVRNAIKNDLLYTYKKVYFRSYEKDDVKIKQARYWVTSTLFDNDYMQDHYMVWMDESSINNMAFK